MSDTDKALLEKVRAVLQVETDMETRIQTMIDALKAPHDSPEALEAIAELTALQSRMAGFEQTDTSASVAQPATVTEAAPATAAEPSTQPESESGT